MEFRNLEKKDKELIQSFYTGSDYQNGWEYDFVTQWLWNVDESVKIAINDDFVLIYNCKFGGINFYPPYVRKVEDMAKALIVMKEHNYCDEQKFAVSGITENFLPYIDKTIFDIIENANNFDYLYSAESLMTLSGKKLHSKRNYINRFIQQYSYTLRDYVPADREKILDICAKWMQTSTHDVLREEKNAIERGLDSYEWLDLKIVVLEVDGNVIGFTMFHIVSDKLVHVFFEKCDSNYIGAYQALNNFTAKQYFPINSIVNRQEDMGIEGLRKAKLSYNPIAMHKKYMVRVK